jgi:putative DNA methylase
VPDAPVRTGLAPLSLRDAPALIESIFPAQKIGVEAQKERKAGAGQTLTALGSYWKGRKPLVLVRACVLASLLPASNDAEADLEMFDALMAMDIQGLSRRSPKVTPDIIVASPAVPREKWEPHIQITGAASGEPGADTVDERTEEAEAEEASPRAGKAKWRRMELSHIKDPVLKRAERARIDAERSLLKAAAFAALPFARQVPICERVEKVENIRSVEDPLYAGIWERVNRHIGTAARSIPELVEQLGIARFGHRPVVGDPFCGGGSIPFEAARVGCNVVASDLNPVAAMLTWGALNIIGADAATRDRIFAEQQRVVEMVDDEITRLGIEHNDNGDRAKAYLYCLETVDPQTGWLVPMAPSWVISRNRRCIARLVPNYLRKCFDFCIAENVSAGELEEAEKGTVREGDLVYELAPIEGGEVKEWRISIARLRRDGEGPVQPDGTRGNLLRRWEISDIAPRRPEWVPEAASAVQGASPGAWIGGDTWLERLYCIQWMTAEGLRAGKAHPATYFAVPTARDEAQEARVEASVRENLTTWQAGGLAPDMAIEPGDKTDEPIRTRGWTYWHHLFTPRHLLMLATWFQECRNSASPAALVAKASEAPNWISRLCQWATSGPRATGGPGDYTYHVFYNQALNTTLNHATRTFSDYKRIFLKEWKGGAPIDTKCDVETETATIGGDRAHIWIYDPPYADAIHYHEITEFFIAWLQKNPPPPFDKWTWDSRRPYAIQGKGEKFRVDMVAAFRVMAEHMPDNGLQICMFTHQDSGVWAEMAQIVWGAGLQVTAAWYVSTETTSELKQGGYVQGTVLLVLRKRQGNDTAYSDELVPMIRYRVEAQVATLLNLNAHARDRGETPFSDADIQMAGYAAALQVLTGFASIDGQDMTRAALRPRVEGESGIVESMIALAVQTATELMVPEGLDPALWQRLNASERFWLKMAEVEGRRPAAAPGKLDDYQTIAKAFRCMDPRPLMANADPNSARLKGAVAFGRAIMEGHEFSRGLVRLVLYAIRGLVLAFQENQDPAEAGAAAIHTIRDLFGPEWLHRRVDAMAIAAWLGRSQQQARPDEAESARILVELIRTERLQ